MSKPLSLADRLDRLVVLYTNSFGIVSPDFMVVDKCEGLLWEIHEQDPDCILYEFKIANGWVAGVRREAIQP